MKKSIKTYRICWAIALVMFNIIAFISPIFGSGSYTLGESFWIGYVFITLAFIGQLLCTIGVFKEKNSRKLFYRIPLITISFTALIISLIFGSICMAVPVIPCWIGAIICVIVLGFSAIAVISANAAANIVEKKDDETKAKTSFIKLLTVDAENLLAQAKSGETKVELKKVYEAIRYSDPLSNDELVNIELNLKQAFEKLVTVVEGGSINDITKAADDVVRLVGERSRKCKVLK